jgi:inositol-pentakisphosphate 2-kinase
MALSAVEPAVPLDLDSGRHIEYSSGLDLSTANFAQMESPKLSSPSWKEAASEYKATHPDEVSPRIRTQPSENGAARTTSIRCRLAQLPWELPFSISLHYLAEGAANIVFGLQPFTDTASTHIPVVFVGVRGTVYPRNVFLNSVIRISKGLDKTLSGQQVKSDFELEIEPLFDTRDPGKNFLEHLLSLEMIALEPSVLSILNQEIQEHSQRWKGKIAGGTIGLLMEDMSTSPGKTLTIEVKPKWLAQSPNAPKDAKRCRTCALQALKNKKKQDSDVYICPLQMHAGNADIIKPWIAQKVREVADEFPERVADAVQAKITQTMTEYLVDGKGHQLLSHIRETQLDLDKSGALEQPTSTNAERRDFNHDLRLAMTLRDCSLFIQVDITEDRFNIQSKLGDLDFKSAAKIKDWKDKENELNEGGWYGDRGAVEWAYGDCLQAYVGQEPAPVE